ncbi:MAG: hypothetical protein B193_1279 [Solidesulfovibrio magneticus str. Maddingley MBC34]|uniref:Uncharacterized protein n=1 Tax=Solidesulfovibrio magneticus str. Maddingley MBC34 TaxID=1206767 RepID=K6GFZ1_9BACT|nr:MAG: hypothetical protein B193_1279 [Solidesulfovibrio magneticus str. Maddingley MBC34]
MANRSRLGRDPLQAAPKPSAAKPAATRRKPAPAKGGAAADTAKKQPVAVPASADRPSPDILTALCPDADPAIAASKQAQPLADADSQATPLAQVAQAADPTPCPGSASPALSTEAHPVAVFLRGVLEGLLPEGEAALCVDVDESTSALPVEKLFFFSHALQRIAMPLENAASAGWRPGAATGPLPVLTARLRPIGRGRHSLMLFDNGCFFQNRLPGLSLGMEALTPLTAFVAKRQGSVVLARGRVTAFEIIG